MGGEDLRKTAEYQAQLDFFYHNPGCVKSGFSAAQLALGTAKLHQDRAKFIRGNPDQPADRGEFSFGDNAGRDNMLLMLDRSAAICALIAEDLERDF